MGRRGPAPTPTRILKIRGSTLVTRKREAGEVQGPCGIPDRPDWLDVDSQVAWDSFVPLLVQMGVLTRVDGKALARYCQLWASWRKAEEFIDKHGTVYPVKDDKGRTKCFMHWPQVSIALKLAPQLTRLEQEFGMTPSARARIQLDRSATPEISAAKRRYFFPD
ncbi:MAG: phage terminase small subunit P27 family [Planctomycetota bacterium]